MIANKAYQHKEELEEEYELKQLILVIAFWANKKNKNQQTRQENRNFKYLEFQ